MHKHIYEYFKEKKTSFFSQVQVWAYLVKKPTPEVASIAGKVTVSEVLFVLMTPAIGI